MRTEAEITADARDGAAFPNGSSYERWAALWCWRGSGCVHDGGDGCPLVGVAMLTGKTPKEWVALDDVLSDYRCTEYAEVVAHATDDDPADDDPDAAFMPRGWRRVETIKGQEGLF